MMGRHDDTTGRTSRLGNFSAVFHALTGSGPPEGTRERLDEIRGFLNARDDDAALGLIAVYETYLVLAQRRMRSAAVQATAVVAIIQLLIGCVLGFGLFRFLDHTSRQNQASVSRAADSIVQRTCESFYGEGVLGLVSHLESHPDQRIIANAAATIPTDDAHRFAQFPHLNEGFVLISKFSPAQWNSFLSSGSNNQKSIQSK